MKRSVYYRRLRPTLRGPLPADAWHDDQWAIFVFDEDNKEGGADNRSGLVLFAVELQTRSVEEVKFVRVDEAHEERT